MPQAINIVLNDAAATPVAHTFEPMGIDPKQRDTFWFVDRSAVNSVGNWRISVQYMYASAPKPGESAKGRVNRIKIGLHEPILETMSNSTVSGILPAPQIAFINRSTHEFFMPERGTLANRKDLTKMSADLLDNAQIRAVIENLSYLH